MPNAICGKYSETLGKYFREKIANSDLAEPFDISIKKSPYQLGIKLTPEIKAKIRGEAPEFGASGKRFEFKI